jgi:hypothetical protein
MNFPDIEGFEWDQGNREKNWIGHKVFRAEIEEIFFNEPLLFLSDEKHSSGQEQRTIALGHTNSRRFLVVVFTIRHKKIRPISARDMSWKERKRYEETT